MSKSLDDFEESCLEKALGFKLPNNNLKKIIQNLSNENLKSVKNCKILKNFKYSQKIFAHLENYQKFDISEFEKVFIKSSKKEILMLFFRIS